MKSTSAPLSLILILGAMAGLTPLAVDMYLPSIPTIADAMAVNISAVQQTLSLFLVGFSIGQLFYGPVADSFGRKPVLIFGLVVFILASLGCAYTENIEQLVVLRFIQAIGGAAGSVIVNALLRDLFEKDAFAKVMSFVILTMTVAPMLAPLIGGQVLVYANWQSIFYLLAVIGLLTLAAVFWKIPETLDKRKRVPIHPLVVIRNYSKVLGHKKSLGYMLTGGFSFAGMFVFITSSPFVYITLLDISPSNYGFYFGANIVMMAAMTWLNGHWVEAKGYPFMLRLGLAILSISAIVMLLVQVFLPLQIWTTVIPVICYVGVMSLIGSNCMTGILNNFENMAGTASAMTGTLRFGIGAIAGSLTSLFHVQSAAPMTLAMAVCALLSVLSYRLLVKTD